MVVLSLMSCAEVDAQVDRTLTLATASRTGAYYRIGSALKSVVDDETRYTLSLETTNGSMENIEMLLSGEADFAFIQGGLGPYAESLVALANIDRELVHVVVPKTSAAACFRDLAGQRISIGALKSGSGLLGGKVVEYLNLVDPPVVQHIAPDALSEAFDNDEVDAAFLVYRLHAPYMNDMLGTDRYTLLPILGAEAVGHDLGGAYAGVIPAGSYGPNRSIPSPEAGGAPTLGVNMVLVTRKDVDDEAVRAVMEALYGFTFRNKAHLTEGDEAWGRAVVDLPLHPAADEYYRRNDPISADRFEIAGFFLAGMLVLVSTFQYLMTKRIEWRRQRMRTAIQPYFKKMVDYGQRLQESNDPEELMDLIHQMMATQRRAEKAWLRGRLNTEDMENLYSVYNTRTVNTFNKILSANSRETERKRDGVEDKTSDVDVSVEEDVVQG